MASRQTSVLYRVDGIGTPPTGIACAADGSARGRAWFLLSTSPRGSPNGVGGRRRLFWIAKDLTSSCVQFDEAGKIGPKARIKGWRIAALPQVTAGHFQHPATWPNSLTGGPDGSIDRIRARFDFYFKFQALSIFQLQCFHDGSCGSKTRLSSESKLPHYALASQAKWHARRTKASLSHPWTQKIYSDKVQIVVASRVCVALVC